MRSSDSRPIGQQTPFAHRQRNRRHRPVTTIFYQVAGLWYHASSKGSIEAGRSDSLHQRRQTMDRDNTSFSQAMDDFFSFRHMMGTSFIRVLYVIGAVAIVLGGVALVIRSLDGPEPWRTWGVVFSVFFAVFGSMLWRVVCEIVIAFFTMFFSMQQTLASIDKSLKEK